MILYAIGITLIWIELSSLRDYGYIESKQKIWHSADAALRVIVSLIISYQAFNTWTFAPVFLAGYWIWFDIRLNLRRKKKFYYIGENSIIDTTFRKIGAWTGIPAPGIMFGVKIILLATTIIIFVRI